MQGPWLHYDYILFLFGNVTIIAIQNVAIGLGLLQLMVCALLTLLYRVWSVQVLEQVVVLLALKHAVQLLLQRYVTPFLSLRVTEGRTLDLLNQFLNFLIELSFVLDVLKTLFRLKPGLVMLANCFCEFMQF